MECLPESFSDSIEAVLEGPNNGDIIASILEPASVAGPEILRYQPGQQQLMKLAAMIARYDGGL